MLKLPSVFSNGALFLHSAPLTVSGECDLGEVRLVLKNPSGIIGAYSAPVRSGRFEITFVTPDASFTEYEIEITSGSERYTFGNILFGELFLASGQSNMEWPTGYMPFRESVYEAIDGKNVRIYFGKPKERNELVPSSPERYHVGSWEAVRGVPTCADASALSVAYAIALYDHFQKEEREVPVGVLSLSVGGVPIEAYLIEEEIRKDPSVFEYIKEGQIMPGDERWNSLGERNRELPTSLYNYLIAPVLGVRVRAMLWYQGEANVSYEVNKRPIYAALLEHLHKSYKKLFAPSPDEAFPIFSSQLFPWTYYQDEDKSCICYAINDAILSLSKKYPDEFYTVPIADLDMSWCFFIGNHPIHPSNKFAVGRRFCDVVSAALYGRKSAQRHPAYLKSVKREGGKIYLRFKSVGSGLYIKGSRIKGLYVRSKRGEYIPAEARVVKKDLLEVYHHGLSQPYHVAYAASDLEYGVNLFAGEYPVIPFSTEMPRRIMRKPWLDTSLDFDVTYGVFEDGSFDFFPRPIYYPISDEELCYDGFYSLTGRSIRVRGHGEYGFKVKASRFAPLDLYNFSSLGVSLLSNGELSARIAAVYEDGKTVFCEGAVTNSRYGNFSDYTFNLSKIKKGIITELRFLFKTDYPYVCADAFTLTPKS